MTATARNDGLMGLLATPGPARRRRGNTCAPMTKVATLLTTAQANIFAPNACRFTGAGDYGRNWLNGSARPATLRPFRTETAMTSRLPGLRVAGCCGQSYCRQDYNAAPVWWSNLERDPTNEAINVAGAVPVSSAAIPRPRPTSTGRLNLPDFADGHSNPTIPIYSFPKRNRHCRAIALSPTILMPTFTWAACARPWSRRRAEAAYRKVDRPRAMPTRSITWGPCKVAPLHRGCRRYQRMLTLRPDYADAHNNLGNLHVESGCYAAAAVAYGRALNLSTVPTTLQPGRRSRKAENACRRVVISNARACAKTTALRAKLDHVTLSMYLAVTEKKSK